MSYAYRLYKIEIHSASNRINSILELELPELTSNKAEKLNSSHKENVDSQPDALRAVTSSEHLIDGRAFDGELQLHFYNNHLVSGPLEAKRLSEDFDGSRSNLFAVISVFLLATRPQLQLQSQPKPKPKPLPTTQMNESLSLAGPLDFILDNLALIPNDGNSIELQLNRSQIEALVPTMRHYVTYQGSQNRPPCAENVDWIILNQGLRVEPAKFQYLFENLNTNQENIRPIRPLNRRLLRTTISISDASTPSKPTNEIKCNNGNAIATEVSHLELHWFWSWVLIPNCDPRLQWSIVGCIWACVSKIRFALMSPPSITQICQHGTRFGFVSQLATSQRNGIRKTKH